MENLEMVLEYVGIYMILGALIIAVIFMIKYEIKKEKEIKEWINTLPEEDQTAIYKYKARFHK